VKIPAPTDNLAPSLQSLLRDIDVLHSQAVDNAVPAGTNVVTAVHTPYSLQVIRSGALSLTKLWATIVAAAGGLTLLGALFAGFWATTNQDERMVLFAAAAVFLSATVLAIAIIVRSDVMARAAAVQARYAVRGDATSKWIDTLICCSHGGQAVAEAAKAAPAGPLSRAAEVGQVPQTSPRCSWL
jgi:hypothetical protein